MNGFVKCKKGKEGEKAVVVALEEEGHTVLLQNYRKRFGEIDIISFFSETLYLWEVKTWKDSTNFHPLFTFNETKKRKLRKLYSYFSLEHPALSHLTISLGLAHRNDKQEVVFYSHLF